MELDIVLVLVLPGVHLPVLIYLTVMAVGAVVPRTNSVLIARKISALVALFGSSVTVSSSPSMPPEASSLPASGPCSGLQAMEHDPQAMGTPRVRGDGEGKERAQRFASLSNNDYFLRRYPTTTIRKNVWLLWILLTPNFDRLPQCQGKAELESESELGERRKG